MTRSTTCWRISVNPEEIIGSQNQSIPHFEETEGKLTPIVEGQRVAENMTMSLMIW